MWTAGLVLAVLALGVVGGSWATGLAEDWLARLGIDPSSRFALAGLVRPTWGVVAVLAALDLLGVPAWQAVLAVAAVGAAIGLLFREPLAILGAGVIVRSSGAMRPGDAVEIDGFRGEVVETGPWMIVLKAPDGSMRWVPASRALAGIVNLARAARTQGGTGG